ncbi:hypothetical protein UY3_00397 [Chelonia mydas]|uniref:C-type lectin domain-containing protein n=1 Tax=Chelonia mydas TaxID=8469 RepID=M7BWY6_CHEMY|nr:hypothetical protein UY3_00397 [Chelonia mydas]
MPVQQRKVKGTPSDINVIYESKDEGTANAQAGPAAVIAVYQLSQKSEQQLEVTEMENIVLLDTLQQLTTGKDAFKGEKTIIRGLIVVLCCSEQAFLKNEISKRVYVYRGQQFSFNFWTGLNYDNDIGNWTWADGSPFSFQLYVSPRCLCPFKGTGPVQYWL